MSNESSSAFILTPSTSLRKSIASKIDSLYEISSLPKPEKISVVDLPPVNPYLPYNKQRHSFTKTV